jgi:hypothetical protein
MQRVGMQFAAVQKGHVTRVDFSLILWQKPLSGGSDGTSTHCPVQSYFQP